MRNLQFKPRTEALLPESYTTTAPSLRKRKQIKKNNDYFDYELNNGLRVILSENRFASGVTGVIAAKAGAKHDPIGGNGIAHLIEHLIFKGGEKIGAIDFRKEKRHLDKIEVLLKQMRIEEDAEKKQALKELLKQENSKAAKYANPNEYNELLKRIGASNINANTDYDRTIFHSEIPQTQIKNWLEINSEIFIQPAFRSLIPELEIIKEECCHDNNDPNTKIYNIVLSNCFKTLPFGYNTVAGKLTPETPPSIGQLRDFYERYYAANNMALIIVGNFNAREIMPSIASSFGKLKRNTYEPETWKEEVKLNGREHITERFAQKDTCVLCFQTTGSKHPDNKTLELIELLLLNTQNMGLLNLLENKGKIQNTSTINFSFSEGGCIAIQACCPKRSIRGLRGTEKLILQQLDHIKKGRFSDAVLESVKQKMIYNNLLSHEDHTSAAYNIANAVAHGLPTGSTSSFSDQVNAIGKREIMAVAAKYFGSDYFCLYARKGKPLETFAPSEEFPTVQTNENGKSVFATKFESELRNRQTIAFPTYPSTEAIRINRGTKLYTALNPFNDIYNLSLKFKIGESDLSGITFMADMLNNWVAEEKCRQVIEKGRTEISCNCNVYTRTNEFIIELAGFEHKLSQALENIARLLQGADFSKERISFQIKREKELRNEELETPSSLVNAFHEKYTKGIQSKYTNRIPMSRLKRMKEQDFKKMLATTLEAEVDIFYSGKAKASYLKNLLLNTFMFKDKKTGAEKPRTARVKGKKEHRIFVLNTRNSNQTQISFFSTLPAFKAEDIPEVEAFNAYFAGGFTGLVFQEIRENRPLAYSAHGHIITKYDNCNSLFSGYVLTHTEKTIKAIETYLSLLDKMPERPEKFKIISEGIINKQSTLAPKIRDAPYLLKQIKDRMANHNLLTNISNKIKTLQFDQILRFYETNIKPASFAICITGDLEQIGLERLEKIARVEIVDYLDFFTL